MGALRAAQWQYDNQLPPPVSESAAEEAEARWFDDGIAELLARRNVVFQRNFHQRGVTYERFAQAVDEFAMGQLERDSSAATHSFCQGSGAGPGRGRGMNPHSVAVSAIEAAIETMLLPGLARWRMRRRRRWSSPTSPSSILVIDSNEFKHYCERIRRIAVRRKEAA